MCCLFQNKLFFSLKGFFFKRHIDRKIFQVCFLIIRNDTDKGFSHPGITDKHRTEGICKDRVFDLDALIGVSAVITVSRCV